MPMAKRWRRLRRWARDNNSTVLPLLIGATVVVVTVAVYSGISGLGR